MSLTEREWDLAQVEAQIEFDDRIQEVMRDMADDRIPEKEKAPTGEEA